MTLTQKALSAVCAAALAVGAGVSTVSRSSADAPVVDAGAFVNVSPPPGAEGLEPPICAKLRQFRPNTRLPRVCGGQ